MIDKIEILKDKIKSAKSIGIAGHKNPDGDSLCSALAMMQLLKVNFDKNATVIYDGNIPQHLKYIPLRERAVFYKELPENTKFDLFILVDYGTRAHLGGAEPFINNADFVIEFDHHFNDDLVGNLCFDNESKAATSQVILDVVNEADFEMDKETMDLLSLAIITDTGHFKFVRNSDVFRNMAYFVDNGVNIPELTDVLNHKKRKSILVESSAVANAEFFYRGKLALAYVKHDDYKKLDGRGDTVLSLLGQIDGVEAIVFLKEQRENQIGLSIRSKSVPIKEIAESLGGGGHEYAAGAVVCKPFEEVYNDVIDKFKGVLK